MLLFDWSPARLLLVSGDVIDHAWPWDSRVAGVLPVADGCVVL